MSLKDVCEELDELAVSYFQALEELSEQRRRVEKFVKEGFLNLSKARYSMGSRAVGSLQYNSTSMSALAHVVTRDEGDCHSYEVHRTAAVKRSERKSVEGSESGRNQENPDTATDSSVTRRRKPQSPGDEVETLTADMDQLSTIPDSEVIRQCTPTDPLLWFGVLVPQALRHGQKNFVDAVEACGSLASLQSRHDRAYAQYRTKLLEKYRLLKQSGVEDGESRSTAINQEGL